MRIAVTGSKGQVVSSLVERGVAHGATVIPVGRPELDLAQPNTVGPALSRARPDIVVNAAAYTAVDQAELEPVIARAINLDGALAVAAAARELHVPLIHLSTDYVFDGTKAEPYVETDPLSPIGVYGRSKADGEALVAAESPDHVILRVAWVYSPFGSNFVRTILRAASTRSEISIVEDQHGNPTCALDIADGIITVARNLIDKPGSRDLRGVFHMVSAGAAHWAEVGEVVFQASKAAGGHFASVKRITTADYPTRTKRPSNSCLDCLKISDIHNVRLPHWRPSLAGCVARLVQSDRAMMRGAA